VQRVFIIALTAVLVLGLQVFVKRGRMGRALRAVQQDAYAARLQGIKVDQVVALTFGIGGVLAGVAGALVAPTQVLLPSMGEGPLLLAFVVIILGGMGSVPGAVLASVGLGMTQSTLSTYWTPQAATWVSFTFVIVVLAVRPKGLLGHE
jgi:branched-chain amino acid transport system permease protein